MITLKRTTCWLRLGHMRLLGESPRLQPLNSNNANSRRSSNDLLRRLRIHVTDVTFQKWNSSRMRMIQFLKDAICIHLWFQSPVSLKSPSLQEFLKLARCVMITPCETVMGRFYNSSMVRRDSLGDTSGSGPPTSEVPSVGWYVFSDTSLL